MNVISGNARRGIEIANIARLAVEGNRVGTDGTGAVAIGNGEHGVVLTSSSGRFESNLVSGNSGNGVRLTGPGGLEMYGNIIGRNASNNGAVPNLIGIELSNASGYVIGSATLGPNTIASNVASGIEIVTGTNNTIGANSIFGNGGLGIDLGGEGVSPNDPLDPDTGANGRQNFPVITTALTSGTASLIAGSLNSTANTSFTLRFFSNAAADPSGHGEGEQYIGSTAVTTNANGDATFSWAGPPLARGHFISATATGPAGTSEFSAVNPAGAMPTIHFTTDLYPTTEGVGVKVTVVREGDLTVTSTVDFATAADTASAGLDFTAIAGTLTFNPLESSKTFNVIILQDSLVEPIERLTVTLTNPSEASLVAPSVAEITITDDDLTIPTISTIGLLSLLVTIAAMAVAKLR